MIPLFFLLVGCRHVIVHNIYVKEYYITAMCIKRTEHNSLQHIKHIFISVFTSLCSWKSFSILRIVFTEFKALQYANIFRIVWLTIHPYLQFHRKHWLKCLVMADIGLTSATSEWQLETEIWIGSISLYHNSWPVPGSLLSRLILTTW